MYMQVEQGDGERTAEVGKGLAPGIVCESIWCKVAWSLLVTDAAGYSELWNLTLRLHKLHGNRWCEVGRVLGVSGQAAQDKYRTLTPRCNKGETLW